MTTCKNCSLPIEIKQGRRPREFCDNNNSCKQQYYLKNKKEKTHKTIPIEQWKEIQAQMGLAKMKSENRKESGHLINIQDLTTPTNIVEPKKVFGSKKSNVTIKSTGLTPYQEMLKKKRGF